MSLLEWIVNNWTTIASIFVAFEVITTGIARLTPTTKDDNFIQKVRKVCETLSNLWLPDRKA